MVIKYVSLSNTKYYVKLFNRFLFFVNTNYLGYVYACYGVCISVVSKTCTNGKKQPLAVHASSWSWSSLTNFLDISVLC